MYNIELKLKKTPNLFWGTHRTKDYIDIAIGKFKYIGLQVVVSKKKDIKNSIRLWLKGKHYVNISI